MTRTPLYIALGVVAALAITMLALSSAQDSRALVTFAVNSGLDEVDADIGDGECVSTPSGVCTLRAAIQETNALTGMDIVDVPAGTYHLTIAGTGEDDAASGDLDLTDDVKIDGASGIAVIDANGIDRVFDIDPDSEGLDIELYDLRIREGSSPAGTSGGGALTHGTTTTLHVERTFFEENTADLNGGGLYNTADLLMIDVEFRENWAGDGGGLFLSGISGATMTNVDFFDNEADSDGGAIFGGSALATLTDGTFDGNWAADRGGAVITQNPFSITTATFTNNGIDPDGVADDTAMGGALFVDFDTVTTVDDVTMDHNRADSGGAVYNVDNLDITSSTISYNRANVDGAGLYNSGLGVLDLANVTVSANEANVNGAGIANYGDLVNMNNVTVAKNIADADINGSGSGGGVFNNSVIGVDMTLSNTIIGDNAFPEASPDCFGTIISNGYNLVENTATCVIGGTTGGDVTGVDPGLVTLGNNGGSTLTHDLLAGSPARDGGNPLTPGIASNACETIDQRELSRPRDGDGNGSAICDKGALEAQGALPTATPVGTPTPTGGATDTPTPTPSPSPSGTATASPTATPTQTAAPVQLEWANANCLMDINPIDSLAVLRADAGLAVTQGNPCVPLGDVAMFDGVQREWGDFDCSGSMSPVDSLKILQFDSGFQPIQTAPCPSFGEIVDLT